MPRLFFDNLDFKILVNIILQNHRPSDMHWIVHYVTFDRVPCDHLDDSKPLSDGTRFEKIEYLLSQGELDKLRSDFIVLVARILADFFEFMEPLQSAIPKHIQHRQWYATTSISQTSSRFCTPISFVSVCYYTMFLDILDISNWWRYNWKLYNWKKNWSSSSFTYWTCKSFWLREIPGQIKKQMKLIILGKW